MHLTHWLALSGAAVLLSCGGSTPTNNNVNNGNGGNPPPGAKTVAIRDFSFVPETLTVKVGTTVVWSNSGPSAHTTTSDSAVWNSGTLTPPSGGNIYGGATAGGTFQYKFTKAGVYRYHCSIHIAQYPNFRGTITVTP